MQLWQHSHRPAAGHSAGLVDRSRWQTGLRRLRRHCANPTQEGRGMICWRNLIIWAAIPLFTIALWSLAYIGLRGLLVGCCS